MTTAAASTGPIHVMATRAERFMVFNEADVDFTPDGVDIVTGLNGAGKTTLQWMVVCAIDPSLAPDEPIKRGEKTSKIATDFGDGLTVEFTVVTKWWHNKNTGAIEAKQHLEWPSGVVTESKVAEWVRQRLGLAKGEGRFDPFELARLSRDKPGRAKQLDMVRRLMGLDVSDLDTKIATGEAERTPIGRRAKEMEGAAAQMKVPPMPPEPGKEKALADLLKRHGEALKQARANDALRASLAADEDAVATIRGDIQELERQLVEAEAAPAKAREACAREEIETRKLESLAVEIGERADEIAGLEDALSKAREAMRAAHSAHAAQQRVVDALPKIDLPAIEAEPARIRAAIVAKQEIIEGDDKVIAKKRAAVAALVDPKVEAIAAEMEGAEAHNAAVRAAAAGVAAVEAAAKAKAAKVAEARAESDRYDAKTKEIEALRAERAARIAACKPPVPGLSIGDGELFFDDGKHGPVPLSQASAAQQVRLWLALRLSLHPRLRFIAVDSWSLLDDGMAAAARAWAVENHVKILAEYVPHGDERPAGLVIEQGAIVADRRPRAEKPAAPANGKAPAAPIQDEFEL